MHTGNTIASPASGCYALLDDSGLIGFRSFGADGQGLGREAISTGLDFGRREFAPPASRVTIATFNIRAQRVVAALGFRAVGSFLASTDGTSYEILVAPAVR